MRLSVSLLALPAPLLTSLAYAPLRAGAAAAPNQRLNPLPAHVKYWPEDGDLHRRQLEKIQQRQQVSPHAPAGVRKMGIDEGEKFYMEYWEFGSSQLADRSDFETTLHEETKQTFSRELRSEEDEEEEEEVAGYSNASIPIPHKPALLLHTDDQTSLNPHFKRDLPYYSSLFARSPRAAFAALRKRAFECPAGTKDCSSVGRATNCCGQGEVCQMLSNTGTDSDVGCCPEGQTCSGSLGKCDAGFTRCSDNIGGGCCIPLYVCVDQGCGPGPSLTSVVVVTPTVTTKTAKPSTSSKTTSSDVATTAPPRTSASASTHACPSSYRSCPASVGGGCCRTDRECGSSTCPASSSASATPSAAPTSTTSSSSSSNAPNAPVRPTGNPPSASASSSPPPTTSSVDSGASCPTGFYQCNAFYHGGCCRVGRDCGLTSCPASAVTSVVNSNGVTVVVPSGAGGTAAAASPSGTSNNKVSPQASVSSSPSSSSSPSTTTGGAGGASGVCASGWSLCPASASGGCCPSGFSCAVSNCIAGPTGASGQPQATGQVGKIAPNVGEKNVLSRWTLLVFVISVSLGVSL